MIQVIDAEPLHATGARSASSRVLLGRSDFAVAIGSDVNLLASDDHSSQ